MNEEGKAYGYGIATDKDGTYKGTFFDDQVHGLCKFNPSFENIY